MIYCILGNGKDKKITPINDVDQLIVIIWFQSFWKHYSIIYRMLMISLPLVQDECNIQVISMETIQLKVNQSLIVVHKPLISVYALNYNYGSISKVILMALKPAYNLCTCRCFVICCDSLISAVEGRCPVFSCCKVWAAYTFFEANLPNTS